MKTRMVGKEDGKKKMEEEEEEKVKGERVRKLGEYRVEFYWTGREKFCIYTVPGIPWFTHPAFFRSGNSKTKNKGISLQLLSLPRA